MSLVPTFQISPSTFFDSFHSSFSKFHGTPLHFFRYASSHSFKTHSFHAIHSSLDSASNNEQNPEGNPRFVYRNNNGRSQISVKRGNFDATQSSLDSESSVEQNPERNSSFLVRNSGGRSQICKPNPNVNVNSGGWIEKWNENNQRNRQKPPQAMLNYRNSGEFEKVNSGGGGSSSSTMEKIVEKLKKFGYIDNVNEEKVRAKERVIEKGSIEDIFYVEEGVLPNSRGGFSADSPLGVENVFGGDGEVRFPWEKSIGKEERKNSVRSQSRTSLAELTLPESELRRLRNLAFQTKSKKKIGGSGVTQAVVDSIHEKWKLSEIVRLKIEGAPALNMKRMHEILERKTGGLVIWRSGTAVVLYRGVSYEVLSQSNKRAQHKSETPYNSFSAITDKTSRDHLKFDSYTSVNAPHESLETARDVKTEAEPLPEIKYEDEVDKLLDGLGPRYTDWAGLDPLPVDADMLPGFVPGFEPPFRILPYGVRSTLRRSEATALRRLARVLPPHFALGRSKQLQGLAVAMVKLWERSSIAKVALKRGVQLTTSERMAEDIKKLTGGILLSRNKDYLVFYRGKNFLSREVTEVLLERERLAKALQDEEEEARLRASASVIPNAEVIEQSRTAGTLAETLDADARWGKRLDMRDRQNIMREAEVLRHAHLVRKLERKLSSAERKLMKAERVLSKVEEFLKPSDRTADPESISDEERFMFRKLGLRMKAFLLLGRRGVFDGTVENMHLHWKYRELVKIILKAKNFDAVKKVALSLEAESGGVLVSVDKISKGYAVIVFRGKDYARPPMLRPKNLLTKRKALARSIELQRREALYNHISALQRSVNKLRSEIKQMEVVEERGDDELYDELESAYDSDDEEAEEEGDDEAYLETYESEDHDEGNTEKSAHSFSETDLPSNIQDEYYESETETEMETETKTKTPFYRD